MASSALPKRVATVAAAFGVTAIAGTTPALAAVTGENIFGAGSSLSKVAHQQVWTPDWQANPLKHPTLSNSPTATYNGNGSGHGLDEFGNNTGALDLTQDPNADNGSTNGYGVPVLDAWAATDAPPTGPASTAGTQLANASLAATGGAATPIREVTVPVAQAPVAVLLSLPKGIRLGPNSSVKLTNLLLQRIWNRGVLAAGGYPARTWGALLIGAGLTKVSGTPGTGEFSDAGGSTGGTQGFTLQVRSAGSGTTYTFKGFLHISGDSKYPQSFVTEDPTWPVAVTTTGNTGGGALVANTTATPGSVGYANLADAATATPGYTSVSQFTRTGGNHYILYAQIQSNKGGALPVQYASPRGSAIGSTNVYAGNNININGANPTLVGHWTVPLSGSTLDPTGTWGGSQASDADVYDHGVTNGVKKSYYPIVAVTFDLGWTSYSEAGSNLVGNYGGSSTQAVEAGNSASSLLTYVVKSSQGQTDLSNAKLYYSRLPAKIDGYAVTAASAVHP